ncbi:MAG: hypothetical protein ABIF77_19640, partial [bacterium]
MTTRQHGFTRYLRTGGGQPRDGRSWFLSEGLLCALLVGCVWILTATNCPAGTGQSAGINSGTDDPPQNDTREGRWFRNRLRPSRQSLTQQQRQQIARLQSLGYVGGSAKPVSEIMITVHDPERAFAGYNFHTTGRGPEAFLRDMEGNILHHWRCDFFRVWPDREIDPDQHHFRRVHLFENGDVLAIFEGMGIVKIDKDSNLIWANAINAHHDLQVMPNGDIWVLSRVAHMLPRIDPEEPTLEDF